MKQAHHSDPSQLLNHRGTSQPARRVMVTAAVAAVTMILAACESSGDRSEDSKGQALEQYRSQELAWTDCDDYAMTAQDKKYFPEVPSAECSRLEVPLDYSDPEADTASIAVVRIPSRGKSLGSVIFNPGGPGGSGLLGTIGASSFMAESAITDNFDLVGFDPRGVGATQPAVDCGLTSSAGGAELLQRISTVVPTLTEADSADLAERCAKGSGGMDALANVGTRTTADDMDILREVLGEDQVNFLGQSYGTRLGAIYAEQYPQNVRAMVLDGAFDPNLNSRERLLASYVGFQKAFEAMAADCATNSDCPLGTDPTKATAVLQTIIQPLAEKSVPAGDTQLDFDLALGGVMSGLYSPDLWPTIISGLREVQQGSGDQLLQLATAISGESNQTESSIAINCVDESVLSAGDLASLRADTYEQAPIMDPGVPTSEATRDKCADFPVAGQLKIPYAQNIEGLPDTLVVSITGDATTPHAGGISLARTLGSTLLTVKGEGHTVIGLGSSPCVDAIAADYFVEPNLPDKELSCTL